jgi:hypothetical protein
MATTRADLRRWVGRLVGDLIVCTATDAGTTATFIDSRNLATENNSLVGRRGFISFSAASANSGLTVRVTSNVKTARSVSFEPELPAATQQGDVLELYHERGLGPTPDEIHAVLNDYIGSVKDLSLTEVQGDGATFDKTQPAIAIDDSWGWFTGADWKDDWGLWHPIPPADLRVNVPDRTVEITNRSALVADARVVRLRGQSEDALLTNDTSTTTVDSEWLAYQAAAQLLISMSHRAHDPAQVERRAQYFQSLADQRRPKVRARFAGKAVKL